MAWQVLYKARDGTSFMTGVSSGECFAPLPGGGNMHRGDSRQGCEVLGLLAISAPKARDISSSIVGPG